MLLKSALYEPILMTIFFPFSYSLILQVRKTTSNKMYEMLLMFDDVIPEENQEEVLTILSETKW